MACKYIAKMAKRETANNKLHFYTLFEPILIIGFLESIKFACDTNGVHKDAAMSPFLFSMKKTAFFELNACLSAEGTDPEYL